MDSSSQLCGGRSKVEERMKIKAHIRGSLVESEFSRSKTAAEQYTTDETLTKWLSSALTWSRVLGWGVPNAHGQMSTWLVKTIRTSMGLGSSCSHTNFTPGDTRCYINLGTWTIPNQICVTPWIFEPVVSTSSFKIGGNLTEASAMQTRSKLKVISLGDSDSCSAAIKSPRGALELTGKLALPIADQLLTLKACLKQAVFIQMHGSRLMFFVTTPNGETVLMATTGDTLDLIRRSNTTSCTQIKTRYSLRIYQKDQTTNSSCLSVSNVGHIKYAGSTKALGPTFTGLREAVLLAMRSKQRVVELTSTLAFVHKYQ